jgi:hypothetical protein
VSAADVGHEAAPDATPRIAIACDWLASSPVIESFTSSLLPLSSSVPVPLAFEAFSWLSVTAKCCALEPPPPPPPPVGVLPEAVCETHLPNALRMFVLRPYFVANAASPSDLRSAAHAFSADFVFAVCVASVALVAVFTHAVNLLPFSALARHAVWAARRAAWALCAHRDVQAPNEAYCWPNADVFAVLSAVQARAALARSVPLIGLDAEAATATTSAASAVTMMLSFIRVSTPSDGCSWVRRVCSRNAVRSRGFGVKRR